MVRIILAWAWRLQITPGEPVLQRGSLILKHMDAYQAVSLLCHFHIRWMVEMEKESLQHLTTQDGYK